MLVETDLLKLSRKEEKEKI